MEFSLDIIKRNDFYQTVLKRPMQITQIEAIKSQIAFQGNQMATAAFYCVVYGGDKILLRSLEPPRPRRRHRGALEGEERSLGSLLKVKAEGAGGKEGYQTSQDRTFNTETVKWSSTTSPPTTPCSWDFYFPFQCVAFGVFPPFLPVKAAFHVFLLAFPSLESDSEPVWLSNRS